MSCVWGMILKWGSTISGRRASCRNQTASWYDWTIVENDVNQNSQPNQCFDPTSPKTLCSLSPAPIMLHIKFDYDWPIVRRNIQVRMCWPMTDYWYTLMGALGTSVGKHVRPQIWVKGYFFGGGGFELLRWTLSVCLNRQGMLVHFHKTFK